MRTLRRLSLASTLATIAVIAIGGFVRSTGSGDGCPDWPKCFGRWFPPLEFEAIVEYTHRYAGAIAISLLAITATYILVKHRSDRRLLVPVVASMFAILGQAGLGGFVVWVKEQAKTEPGWRAVEGSLVTFHIATAMLLVAALILISVRAFRLEETERGVTRSAEGTATTRRWAFASLAGVFALIMVGAYVRGTHAGLAFHDWPLMDGGLLPELVGVKGAHFAHRAIAAVVVAIVLGFAIHAVRTLGSPRRSALSRWAVASAVLIIVQSVVGGLQVLTDLDAVPVGLHVLLSALTWGSLVVASSLTQPLAPYGSKLKTWSIAAEPTPAPIAGAQVDVVAYAAPTLRIRDRVAPYVALTKPRIIVLLLITTVPAMVLAAGGWPDTALVGWTLLGGTLGAGAANAINMVIDRDIDAIMSRTRRRPLPAHDVTPGKALVFAMSLAAISFVMLVATTNLLSAVLVQSAIAFYVFVYTLMLKRSTPQNIVIGGAAGAVPALVGWSAVTDSLSLEAWLLFAIIFAWTPAHFWALAIRFSNDYKAAGVPMLPVVAGRDRTQRAILGYTLATVALSAGLWQVADLSWVYALSAAALGIWFSKHAIDLWRAEHVTAKLAMNVFKASILYLGLLFGAVAADVLVL